MNARPVAVVTGASRGLGFLLARELADRGHDLVVNARSESGLATAAVALQEHGAAVVTVPGDVADPALGQQLVDAATERFGRLDVLVTNAGSIQVGPAFAMRSQDFTNAMDVMFYGVLHPVLAPSTTMRLVSVVNRLLPGDETPRPMRPGHAVEKPARWFDSLTTLTRRAARRYHQHDDATADPAPSTRPERPPTPIG